MLACSGGTNGLSGMLIREAAQRDDMDFRVGQHIVEVPIYMDWAPMLGGESIRVELAGRTDRGHLRQRARINRRYVGSRHPSVTNDPNVILFHRHAGALKYAMTNAPNATTFAPPC